MPKAKKKPRSAKKEAPPSKKAQYILDDAGDKVWITTVTLADIKKACKTGQGGSKRRELVRIPSKQNRQSIYTEAGIAIANKEQESMALYGGRPWKVTARVSEPKNNQKPPLFRWYRGELELAVLPHLLEKIPEPPKLKGNQEYTEEEEYVPSTSLEERTVSSLSWVAWENLEYAIPNVTVKWLSPDHVYFYSRKSAWEHQNKLAEQQLFLQKILCGLGHRGQKLKPFKPTKNDATKAGKWRFLRDGLWVVGQEEAWQEERAKWWEEELERKAEEQAALEAERAKQKADDAKNEDKKPAAKRSLTALAYFLQCERQKYREERIAERKLAQGDSTEPITMTLRQAETELRDVWKTFSGEEQEVWQERVKQLYSKETEDETKIGTETETQKEPSVSPAESDVEVAAAQTDSGVQPHPSVANAGASGEEPVSSTLSVENHTSTPVSPSPPSVPTSEEERQTGNAALVPGSRLISESSSLPMPQKECTASSTEQKADTAPLEPGSRVLSESEASNNDVFTVNEAPTGTSASPLVREVANGKAETNGITLKAKISKPASSAKKRRKSASRPLKKINPSPQFKLSPEQIELCHTAATTHFEMVMNTVKARALHSELQDGFDLLRERGRGRYDMELPAFENSEFGFLTDLQKAAWMPIVRDVLGDDVVLIHKGAFLSNPGAAAQEYHQDGPHLSTQTQRPCHAVNVFIPLVDLHLRNGPTEFCLGTHILGHEGYTKDRIDTPCVPAGTPVMFDYRLGHRGMANTSGACRPIVYCTYAAAANGKEFRDSVNFSRRRYHKIGSLVEKPLSRAERAAKRRKKDSPVETPVPAPQSQSEVTATAIGEAESEALEPQGGEPEQVPVPAQPTSAQEATSENEAESTAPQEPAPTRPAALAQEAASEHVAGSTFVPRRQELPLVAPSGYSGAGALNAMYREHSHPQHHVAQIQDFRSQQILSALGLGADSFAPFGQRQNHPLPHVGAADPYADARRLAQVYAYQSAVMQQRPPVASPPARSDGSAFPASNAIEDSKSTGNPANAYD